jgi:hypothetical protein
LADEAVLTQAMLAVMKTPPEQLKKQTEAALAVFENFSHKSAVHFTESLYEKLTGA